MGNLAIIDKDLLRLIESYFDGKGFPMPFTQEIFLIETRIAGTSHLDLKELEPRINIGDNFIFRREPENQFDDKAILIFDSQGNKLGYVPMDNNEILSNLMDSGKIIFGKLEYKEWFGKWLKLSIKIFMRD